MATSISYACFLEECFSDVFAQVLWTARLPSLSSWLHLNNYVSRGLCLQVITMTFEFVLQCLTKVVGNVATGSYCSLQALTNFPSSSVPMVFVSGVLGGVSRFSDVLLRSLVSQVIKILFEGWCDSDGVSKFSDPS